jgi:hypothetical protein
MRFSKHYALLVTRRSRSDAQVLARLTQNWAFLGTMKLLLATQFKKSIERGVTGIRSRESRGHVQKEDLGKIEPQK